MMKLNPTTEFLQKPRNYVFVAGCRFGFGQQRRDAGFLTYYVTGFPRFPWLIEDTAYFRYLTAK